MFEATFFKILVGMASLFRQNHRPGVRYQTFGHLSRRELNVNHRKMPATKTKRARNITDRTKRTPISKVWMLSHECAGLAQAGGLGEAVAGLSKTLAVDSKLDVTVFLPSHGRHLGLGFLWLSSRLFLL